MKKYTDKQVLDRVEQLPSFKGWKVGVYDVWIRSEVDEYNKFDDKVFTYECLKEGERPEFILACTGTTNPGAEGLKNFNKYNRLGCAVLKSDELIYNSHIYGKHKQRYYAYIQSMSVGFPYFRDMNKNTKSEEIGKEYNDRIGANCHKAGVHSTIVGGWSVACLVRNDEAQYNAWMKFMNKRKNLSVVILKEF